MGDYASFFETIFDKRTGFSVFPYQRKLGEEPVRSRLIHVPTGAGKTAAAIMAWLWRRHVDPENTPRRLVYCLPMRVLVEQTRDKAKEWVGKVAPHVGVHTLMGGEVDEGWELYPEKPAILIGSQDMLLSRALNRGYAMSRYRWPVHFGLLNNDCLWVCDEVQLMGPGLASSLQLEAFREEAIGATEYFKTERPCISWYMSATAGRRMLASREWRRNGGDKRPADFVLELSEAEIADTESQLGKCWTAVKSVECHPDWHFEEDDAAERIWDQHRRMVEALAKTKAALPRRTLVMCNRVDRAQSLHQRLTALLPQTGSTDLVLLHSRFRPADRERQMRRLAAIGNHTGGQIVVATQVIEAGVDLSSAILWTEIAPVPSIVQRLGRLNRAGEFGYSNRVLFSWTPQAVVVGIRLPEIPPGAKKEDFERLGRKTKEAYLPYDRTECELAFEALQGITDGSPANLDQRLRSQLDENLKPPAYSLLRHELLDFFDTDSNVSLGYTDVSRFVRGIDRETDVYVVWRDWPGSEPPFDFDPVREEICQVPMWKVRDLETWHQGFIWQGKASGWRPASAENLLPGATLLLPLSAGGYSEDAGWTGKKDDNRIRSEYVPPRRPSDEDLLSSLEEGWQGISEHTADVREQALAVLSGLGIDPDGDEARAILLAIKWHDYGKNHAGWQDQTRLMSVKAQLVWPGGIAPIAKFSVKNSPLLKGKTGDDLQRTIRQLRGSFRPALRHEVASALALRQHSRRDARTPGIYDVLSEYLVMSHHGQVRKVLRDELPRGPWRSDRTLDAVRGILEGARLEGISVMGEELPTVESLSIECRQMGRCSDGSESWTRGVLRLLAHFGPFRLAFCEALLRAADRRASAAPKTDVVTAQPRQEETAVKGER